MFWPWEGIMVLSPTRVNFWSFLSLSLLFIVISVRFLFYLFIDADLR